MKAMLAKGATASAVALEMHIGRDAVIGRIYRDPEMTLPGYTFRRAQGMTKSPPRPPRKVIVNARIQVEPLTGAIVCTPVEPPPPPPVFKPSAPHPMALIGTGRRWCKWPVEEAHRVLGHFFCCGAQVLPGDVYCDKHRELARRVMPCSAKS